MNSIDLAEKRRSGALAENWLDAIARKLIFRLMKNIRVGRLTIEENGETYNFGQTHSQTDIVAHISVLDSSAYRQVLFNGTIGSGEAYMENAWSSPDLVQVIRLMVLNMEMLQQMDSRWSVVQKVVNGLVHRLRNANSLSGAQKNIAAHYDLGNDFFSTFLDPSMLYSAAIYPHEHSSLHEASVYKMKHICTRLGLKKTDHLLEIGCGWGGMAVYAAKHFGCKVTSVTISKEQWAYANEWVKKEGLSDLVEIRLQDYRDIRGVFDKIVSIEMIEAVGYEYYPTFFAQCSKLLKPSGLMLMQGITIADQRFEQEKDNVDFIQKYIFPGGCLPSLNTIAEHLTKYTDMQLVGLEDITLHYANTLKEWRSRFFYNINEVKKQGFDDVFVRMWDFYLCYCEGGFRERVISTSQILMAKPRCLDLPKVQH